MIDANQMVERFLVEAVRQCSADAEGDEVVIRALNDRSQNATARSNEVRKWLRYYAALQGLNAADRESVPNLIVEFADARTPIGNPLSEAEITEKFDDLHKQCSLRMHRKKNGGRRSPTSLTSKALWCCYPDAIPLFDAYAQRSLWVISRLIGLDRPPEQDDDTPYTRFLKVWLKLYRSVTIDDTRLGDYPYKVRVFDKILWIIGEPDYGLTDHPASAPAPSLLLAAHELA